MSRKQQSESPSPVVQMKLAVGRDEHTVIRTAAALRGTSMRDFAKEAVLQAALKELDKKEANHLVPESIREQFRRK